MAAILFYFPTEAANDCPSGKHWVKAHSRRAYIRSDGTKVSASNVIAHCREFTKTFLSWNPRLDDAPIDGWPHKTEKFHPWKPDERERLIEALETLPEEILNANVRTLRRATRSKDFPNPATSSKGIMVLYDNAFDSKNNLARIVAHELAHQKYHDMTDQQRKEYGLATNWFPTDKKKYKYISRYEGYVQDDGRANPEEDHANNIEYYLFDPKELERVTPQAFRWIKNHYGDNFKLGRAKR